MAALVSDIVEAMSNSVLPLQNLTEVEVELNQEGRPIYMLGGNAVVFRVLWRDKRSALRCYMRPKSHLKEIYKDRYYPNELMVESKFIDVVICDWVEGESLNRVVNSVLESGDRTTMRRLSESFNRLASRMLSRRDWAHGDLSLRNIVVGEDLEMDLIDHDSNYVEELAGCESVELGTPTFQSPLRTSRDFGANLDDFSITLISVVLRVLSLDMTLVDRFPSKDGLLLDGAKVFNRYYEVLEVVLDRLASYGEFTTYRLAKMLKIRYCRFEMLSSLIDCSKGSEITCSTEGIETFENYGIWGYCNMTSGEVAILPLFDEAFEFRGDEALVRASRWWFYIDRKGRVIESCGEWIDNTPPTTRKSRALSCNFLELSRGLNFFCIFVLLWII